LAYQINNSQKRKSKENQGLQESTT